MNDFSKFKAYLKRYGIVKLCHKAIENSANFNAYNIERMSEIVTDEEIEKQKKHVFANPTVISIIVPVFNTEEDALVQTLNSVKGQTYPGWQLCIADAGDERENT